MYIQNRSKKVPKNETASSIVACKIIKSAGLSLGVQCDRWPGWRIKRAPREQREERQTRKVGLHVVEIIKFPPL